MTVDQTLQVVQVSYPQVYLACHTRHQRKRSTDHRLSARDQAILSHLDAERLTLPSRLATHLRVSRSTVSEALRRLTQLGFVIRGGGSDDKRTSGARLSPKGVKAIRDTSVLETARLRAALALASPADRAAISLGMTRLAEVCRGLTETEGVE
jgi:MarR family transcriptional regulator, organic hydroperoxide resistance regulator